MTKLVVHVPHASIAIPDDIWPEFLIDPDRANQEAMVSADLYTELMAREAWPNAEIIEAPVSRIIERQLSCPVGDNYLGRLI